MHDCDGSNLCAGRDATSEYDSVGHSKKANEIASEYLIGHVEVRVQILL